MEGSILKLDCLVDEVDTTRIVFIDVQYNFIGSVSLQYKNRRSANISYLYVHGSFRKKGVGARLVKECCSISKEYGCESLGLLVDKDNQGVEAFYKGLGFVMAYEYDDKSTLMSIIF